MLGVVVSGDGAGPRLTGVPAAGSNVFTFNQARRPEVGFVLFCIVLCCVLFCFNQLGATPGTPETEAGRSLSSMPSWSTEGIPGLHRKALGRRGGGVVETITIYFQTASPTE